MILYRVSNHADLTGKGGELADGRWHTRQPGKRIVYLSDHPALCLLEILAHVDTENDLPDTFQLLSVEIPNTDLERLDRVRLPDLWQHDHALTRQIGDAWLLEGRSLGLLVPSAIVPVAQNCLMNPLLSEASNLRMKVVGRFPFDPRLVRPLR